MATYASSFAQYMAAMSPGPSKPPQEVKDLPERITAEPIEAWRVWKIRQAEQVTLTPSILRELSETYERGENPFAQMLLPSLGAIGYEHRWARTIEATCLQRDNPNLFGPSRPREAHAAPHVSCSCGIWALKDEPDVERTVWEYAKEHKRLPGFAFGRVQLWGRIVGCERGYRSQYARPIEIVLLSEDQQLAGDLARRYGCETRCEVPRSLLRIFWQERKLAKAKAEAERAALARQHEEYSRSLEMYRDQRDQYGQSLFWDPTRYPIPPSPKRRRWF